MFAARVLASVLTERRAVEVEIMFGYVLFIASNDLIRSAPANGECTGRARPGRRPLPRRCRRGGGPSRAGQQRRGPVSSGLADVPDVVAGLGRHGPVGLTCRAAGRLPPGGGWAGVGFWHSCSQSCPAVPPCMLVGFTRADSPICYYIPGS